MRNRIALLFSVLFLSCFVTRADLPFNQYWTKANSFYKQKNFDSSVYYYEKIAELKPANPELYYNLGNAYYRSNDIAQSILNYKRALKLRPGYTQAQDNLLLAQSRMTAKAPYDRDIFFIAWWKQITSPAFSQVWAVTALVLFLILIGSLFWFRWRKVYSQMHRGFILTVAVLFLFTIITAFVSADKRNSNDEAVVMSPDAVFKEEVKNAKSEMLPEGTIVECKDIQGEWTSVKLSDGRQGWVRTDSIERI